MAMKIIINAIENQSPIVLNCSLSDNFLLANAEPIVMIIMAVIISEIWISPKNTCSKRVFGFVKIFPEVSDHRAFKIKYNSYGQLNMSYRCSPVPYLVICSCKFSVGRISFEKNDKLHKSSLLRPTIG